MLTYLLKSGVCLAVFYLFYKLLLEKEPIHIFKRIYLLGGLVLAFAIPLITFTTIVEVEPIGIINYGYAEIPFEPGTAAQEATPINYWPIILWTVYGFGLVLFGLKFLFNLFQIGTKVRRNSKQKVQQFTHVLLEHLNTPHTFFNYIFLNKQRYLKHEIPQEVFWHEETHAKQKHSFDIVLLEILQVVFWFNPLLYFIKKDIKLNHEFLADNAVLNKGVSLTAYQEILLTFSTNSTEPQLANALNYSSIKKRFKIMKTKTSKKAVWIKSLILLPLVMLLIYGFSEKVTIEKVIEPISNSENYYIAKDDITIYISKNREVYFNNTPIAFNTISTEIIKISNSASNITPKIFIEIEGHLGTSLLSELGQEISKTSISIIEFKADSITLNDEDGATFKDARFISNSIIINTKDGESIKGVSMSSKEHGNKATPEEIVEYNKLAILYNKQPEDKRVIKLTDLSRLEFIFNKMTIKQKVDAESFPNCPPTPPKQGEMQSVPMPNEELAKVVLKYNTLKAKQIVSKNSTDSNNLTEQLESLESSINKELEENTNSITKTHQDKATKEEVAEYNKLAKHYNNMSKNDMVIKLEDMNRLSYIFKLMTNKQKQNAEPFPNFPPPPPPAKMGEKVVEGKLLPPPPPIPANATPEQKEKYNKAIQNYKRQIGYTYKTESGEVIRVIEEETPVVQGYRIPPPPPPVLGQKTIEKGSKQLQEAYKKFSEEANLYGKSIKEYMSTKKGLNKVENQYKKVMELHKEYAKLATNEGVLPPPPPPPATPPNPTDHMIEMAKQGALFYYEDKKISSDKAIEITKKNKSINIQVLGHGSSKPVVKLSKKPITVKKQ